MRRAGGKEGKKAGPEFSACADKALVLLRAGGQEDHRQNLAASAANLRKSENTVRGRTLTESAVALRVVPLTEKRMPTCGHGLIKLSMRSGAMLQAWTFQAESGARQKYGTQPCLSCRGQQNCDIQV